MIDQQSAVRRWIWQALRFISWWFDRGFSRYQQSKRLLFCYIFWRIVFLFYMWPHYWIQTNREGGKPYYFSVMFSCPHKLRLRIPGCSLCFNLRCPKSKLTNTKRGVDKWEWGEGALQIFACLYLHTSHSHSDMTTAGQWVICINVCQLIFADYHCPVVISCVPLP